MHKILERQLRHLGIATEAQSLPTLEQWNALLERVSTAYADNDTDRYTMERSIDLSSKEMEELHQRLASERDKLRSIFETAPLGIFRLSPDGEILDANPAALQMLGRARADLSGRAFRALFDDEGTPLQEGQGSLPATVFERRYAPPAGEMAWLHSTETWVRDPSGAVQFGTVVVEDVTTRKHLEGSLRHAQKLESVGRLAAGIAHELNTAIQFINDNVHFMQGAFVTTSALISELTASIALEAHALLPRCREAEEAADWAYLESEVPKSVHETIDGLKRIAKIVQSMKNFSHNDQGVQTPVDLNAVLESTLTVAGHELRTVAEVRHDFGDIPLVMCSQGDLGQVFLNLLVNAAHAIGDVVEKTKGLGTITVVTRCEGEHVVVSISDTGAGIPESVKVHLFEPFFTTKEVGRGSGQGLALARTIIVQNHRGALTFDTAVGAGTTFHIRLPIGGVQPASTRTV